MSGAIAHLLRQLQRDARLAYLIGPGSQSYELLTQEAATEAGREVVEYRHSYEATLKFERWPSQDNIADRIKAGAQLLAAVQQLEKRGFFTVTTCADKATSKDMRSVLAAMSSLEDASI